MVNVLQEQVKEQEQTIARLQETVRQQAEDLDWTQNQLINTQSSLIDLEGHLTTLEEQQAEQAAASAASSAAESTRPGPVLVSSPDLAQQPSDPLEKFPLSEDALQQKEREDEVQSAFVSSIDSLFPPSPEGSEDDDTADVPELHEDPFELFEKGKAAVQARAKKQNAEQTPPAQQPSKPDMQTGQHISATRSNNLTQQNPPQGKHCATQYAAICPPSFPRPSNLSDDAAIEVNLATCTPITLMLKSNELCIASWFWSNLFCLQNREWMMGGWTWQWPPLSRLQLCVLLSPVPKQP